MKLFAHAVAVLAALALPSVASALQMTLTFDSGMYDPDLTYPGGGYHGPYDWLESGARISGWWAEDVGTPQGAMALMGHTHLRLDSGNPTGYAESTHSWTGDIQGLEISLLSGATFDLISVDYDIRNLDSSDPLQQRLPWSFAPNDPHLVVTSSFDPTAADFEGEFTAFAASDDGNWRTHDWFTQSFVGLGFTNLTSVIISQTASSAWIDNIVIDVHTIDPVPEPTTALLFGLGLVVLARRPRDRD